MKALIVGKPRVLQEITKDKFDIDENVVDE